MSVLNEENVNGGKKVSQADQGIEIDELRGDEQPLLRVLKDNGLKSVLRKYFRQNVTVPAEFEKQESDRR